MREEGFSPWRMFWLCGLSLSIGWGVRGNFGHENGAMIPGALAGMAAALASGRPDWWRRVAYFGLFGALGWSFGATISYMRVIAYTHSGHLPSQVYGFACLFVIGFAWGALGGAGTALPACLDRRRLTELFTPMLLVLAAWILKDLLIPLFVRAVPSELRHESPLYWHDTNWVAALVALVTALLFAAVRRRICWGTSLILHLAIGWWAGFLCVVLLNDGRLGTELHRLGFEFRMTPPRGDNWAGALGMTGGALLFFCRTGLLPVARVMLVSGIIGGFGFLAATFLKLVEVKYVPWVLSQFFGESAWQTNWHSVLEQTYGFVNGAGLAVAMSWLARQAPRVEDEPPVRRWTDLVAVAFVLLAITFVNLIKTVPNWVKQHAVPSRLYGLPAGVWYTAGYAVLAAAVVALLARHLRRRLAVVPETWLGKGQLLYLVLLWWVVVGNLMLAIPPFQEQRLITEGVIHVNAVLCTVLVLVWPRPSRLPEPTSRPVTGRSLTAIACVGLVILALATAGASYGTRLIHGDAFVGHAGYHTRFGPDAETGKPREGEPHP